MINGAFLILLLLAVSQAAPITKANDAYISFPEFNQNINFVKVNFNFNTNASSFEQISQLIKSWSIKLDDKINEDTSAVNQGESSTKGCSPKVYTYK
jgi:hypothetical protein